MMIYQRRKTHFFLTFGEKLTTAHQIIHEKRWTKDDDIPLTKNVIALRDHLRIVEDEARAKLTQQINLGAYKALNETVLAQVIIFNKCREGEASRLKV